MKKEVCTKPCREKAYTLLELSIVLGIIGIMMGGLWTIAGTGGSKAKQELLSSEILSIVKGVRTFFEASSGVSTSISDACLTSCLVAENLMPPEMVRLTSNDATSCNGGSAAACQALVDHPWGKNTANASTGGVQLSHGATAQQFAVKLLGLEQSQCAMMAMGFYASKAPSGMLSLAVNTATVTVAQIPLSAKTALSLCNITDPTKLNSLSATYRLRPAQN